MFGHGDRFGLGLGLGVKDGVLLVLALFGLGSGFILTLGATGVAFLRADFSSHDDDGGDDDECVLLRVFV